jgi:hypothetical protein
VIAPSVATTAERCAPRERDCRHAPDRRNSRERDGSPPSGRADRSRTEPPTTPSPAQPGGGALAELPAGNPDPFRSLGAGSPFCRRRGVRSRPGCRIAGAIAHTYSISNYGLDVQIETGITKVEDNLFAALQSVAALCWLGLVYALKGVLLLLEWAFSLDLLNEAMRSVREALERLHRGVLGTPWFMAAIAVSGLWGIWHGLVRRRTGETIGGLAATLALMVGALVVINNPTGTVGHASRLANEASLGFMAAASTGTLDRPAESLASGSERLFDALVLRPWCALQFGDVGYCTHRRRGGFSNADLWLAFPADGKERQALYRLTKGEEPDGGGFLDDVKDTVGDVIAHGPAGLAGALADLATGGGDDQVPAAVRERVERAPAKVRLQEKGGTFTRIALLLLVALGLSGAICLLLYLAVKLVLAGLLALILLLLAPAMLLAPAFGYSGRTAFLGWAKRLVGALAAKLVYALLLALVVVAATALASLEIGWFGTWLLQIAFWWGILIKRRELTGFLSLGQDDDRPRHQSAIVRTYQAAHAAAALGAGARAATLAAPTRARAHAREISLARQQAGRRATALAAEEELGSHAERARELELAGARGTLALRGPLERDRRALERELAPLDRTRAKARATGQEPRPPTAEEELWLDRRAMLERALDSERMRQAERTLAEIERALAREGRIASRAEAAAWREQRRRDIEQGLPADHKRSLRAAGVDPRDFADADQSRKQEYLQASRAAIARDRSLLAALPGEGAGQATPGENRRARSVLSREELQPRRREERARAAHERRERRRRHGLYRR